MWFFVSKGLLEGVKRPINSAAAKVASGFRSYIRYITLTTFLESKNMNKKIIALAVAAAVSAPMAAQAGVAGSVALDMTYSAANGLGLGVGQESSVTFSASGKAGNGMTTAAHVEFDLYNGAYSESAIKLSTGAGSFTITDGKIELGTTAGALSLGLGVATDSIDVSASTSMGGMDLSFGYTMPDGGANSWEAGVSTNLGGAAVGFEATDAGGATAWTLTAGVSGVDLEYASSGAWSVGYGIDLGGGVSLGLGYGSTEVASGTFSMSF